MKRTRMKGRKIFLYFLFLTLWPLTAISQVQRTISIDELFSLIETSNASLHSQRSNVDVTQQALSEARSQRLPDVNAQLSASYNGNVVMTNRDFSHATGFSSPHLGNSFVLEAQQVVYAGGALNASIRLAKVRHELAENGVEMTREKQRFMAFGQYLELFKLDNSIKVYESDIALTEKLIADIKAKQTEGMALKNDVTRYELQMETLRLGCRKLVDSRSILNHQLCNSLGLSNTIIIPDPNVVNQRTEEFSENDWQMRATVSSTVLKASNLGIQAANEQLALAKSDLLPHFSMFAAETFNGPFTYDIPPIDKNFNVWYVGIGVRYSLSSLFKNNKSVRRARATLQQSELEQIVSTESVNNSIQEAYTLYKQSFVDLRTRQKSVELANSNYQVMNDRYLNQLALVTDMVNASNLKLDAELQEVNARANIVYTYYKLKFLAGEL